MSRMTVKGASWIGALVLASMLSACGGNDSSGDADGAAVATTASVAENSPIASADLMEDSVVNKLSLPSGTGLSASYFYSSDFTGASLKRVDATVNFDWGTSDPVPNTGDRFGVQWRGQVQPEFGETYTFHTLSDDGIRVWVNGQLVINNWTSHPPTENAGQITLVAGQRYDIAIDYFDSGIGAVAKLYWSSPSQARQIVPQGRLFPTTSEVAAAPTAPAPVPVAAPVPVVALVTDDKAGPKAMRAAAFIDTIGVNAHFERIMDGRTIWAQKSEGLRAKLLESGIPHIRTSLRSDMVPGNQYMNYLKTMPSVKVNLQADWSDDLSKIPGVGSELGAQLVTLESRNEPDLRWSDDAPQKLRKLQKDLFDIRNANASLANVKILGPSVLNKWAAEAVGDMSSHMDFLNPHMYVGASAPEQIYGHNGSDGNGYGSFRRAKEMHSIMGGDKCMMITEAGEHNKHWQASGHLGKTEKIAGRMIPRAYLELARHGACRTFMYELVDEPLGDSVESHFGLVRGDLSEKPAFKAVKNMITLLKDTAPNGMTHATGQLNYTVGGNTANVVHVLFQKADGTFYLAIWLGKNAWDWKSRTEVAVPNQNVTLNVSTRKTARVHTLDDAGAMTSGSSQGLVNGKLDLTVSDRVTFVELK